MRRLSLKIFSLLLVFLMSAGLVSAETASYLHQTVPEYSQKLGADNMNGEISNKFGWETGYLSAGTSITGTAEVQDNGTVTMNTENSALGNLAGATDMMFGNRPASTVEYIADIGSRAGFVTPAYAQGTGWSVLNPVLKIWRAFRNIAYFGYVIIFVVIGFMIMFRSKIGGQAAITVQMALPQIIISLLLVTFSYAIVSLMIDLIYVLIYFIVGIFSTFGILEGQGILARDILLTESILEIVWRHMIGWGDFAGSAAAAINSVVESMFSNLINNVTGDVVGFVSGGLAYLIIASFLMISVFKVFFMLLKAYISIIFGIIFGPLILMLGAIPGRNTFQVWFMSILANAIVFPVTAALILIGVALTGANNDLSVNPFGVATGIGYNPSQVQDVALPFLALNTSGIVGIVGLAFVMMLPSTLELVFKTLQVEPGVSGMVADTLQAGYKTGTIPANFGVGQIKKKWDREAQARALRKGFPGEGQPAAGN